MNTTASNLIDLVYKSEEYYAIEAELHCSKSYIMCYISTERYIIIILFNYYTNIYV